MATGREERASRRPRRAPAPTSRATAARGRDGAQLDKEKLGIRGGCTIITPWLCTAPAAGHDDTLTHTCASEYLTLIPTPSRRPLLPPSAFCARVSVAWRWRWRAFGGRSCGMSRGVETKEGKDGSGWGTRVIGDDGRCLRFLPCLRDRIGRGIGQDLVWAWAGAR
ncbi:uncharacterized protein K452DRAFT_346681 [Aplosporella prunicola CBS 121167]|uniref:Uncharacterized protein n=1 Tax=Aplosporella prunicola CBS 121167 TaxID=1176127 RepID=A0A6A6AUM5_9PEZI|nr:uncharacterized protein K452DRAFT_346681 [Aplosporella prunicola CBS 121167]KAF2135732.1 hypothetical protein K452DRAFT_346681 [Aplosporella prunicola CBS 121167]